MKLCELKTGEEFYIEGVSLQERRPFVKSDVVVESIKRPGMNFCFYSSDGMTYLLPDDLPVFLR